MVSVPKIKTFPGKYFSSANEDETGLQSINRGPFCPLHLQYTGYVSVCHQPTQLHPFMLSLGGSSSRVLWEPLEKATLDLSEAHFPIAQ